MRSCRRAEGDLLDRRAGGKANAAAQALADAAREDPSKRDSIAQAIAEATDMSKEDANLALQKGDVANLAEAIAVSSGGKTTATAISLSQVGDSTH